MATFSHGYGPAPMLDSVAVFAKEVEANEEMDIHTITLTLNGQHGEFDLVIEATDQDLEDHRWEGVAHRSGGVRDFRKVEV